MVVYLVLTWIVLIAACALSNAEKVVCTEADIAKAFPDFVSHSKKERAKKEDFETHDFTNRGTYM
jgi:hypothetical protein